MVNDFGTTEDNACTLMVLLQMFLYLCYTRLIKAKDYDLVDLNQSMLFAPCVVVMFHVLTHNQSRLPS